jgi:hypothetical protein
MRTKKKKKKKRQNYSSSSPISSGEQRATDGGINATSDSKA